MSISYVSVLISVNNCVNYVHRAISDVFNSKCF
jgi:hypothetical protein